MNHEVCHEHSGCLKDIDNLKIETRTQWEQLSKTNQKVDDIMTRLNMILGALVVSALMLAANLIFKVV
jgi:hypothetical protein